MKITKKNEIILYDGVCNLCNNSVLFIIKRDPKKQFKFASLQSNFGVKIINAYPNLNNSLNTIVLVNNNTIFIKSTAVLMIFKHLGKWKVFYPLIYLPVKFRDKIYDFIASHRYNWFGKKNHCALPNKKYENRFIDF